MQKDKFTGNDIVRDIEKQILDNNLAQGVRLSTGRELAARYQVSLKTVERAMARLRHRGLISRVRGRGSFVLSSQPMLNKLRVCFFSAAHSTYQHESAPQLTFAAFDYLRQQMHKQLFEAGYNLDYVIESLVRGRSHSRLMQTCLDKYDIVIVPAGVMDYAEEYLRNCKSQLILILDDIVRYGPWHQIVYDYRPGFRQAIQLFRKLGCRKIIVVGCAGDTSRHRVSIFREEALRLGYAPDDIADYFGEQNAVSYFLIGQNLAEYYLEHKLFDHGIFSTSDFLTLGMCNEFKRRNIVPGRDLQLISYDNFEGRLNRSDFNPDITSITHPQDEMLKALLSLLESLEKIPSGNDFYKTYFVPARELVLRGSTANGRTLKTNASRIHST